MTPYHSKYSACLPCTSASHNTQSVHQYNVLLTYYLYRLVNFHKFLQVICCLHITSITLHIMLALIHRTTVKLIYSSFDRLYDCTACMFTKSSLINTTFYTLTDQCMIGSSLLDTVCLIKHSHDGLYPFVLFSTLSMSKSTKYLFSCLMTGNFIKQRSHSSRLRILAPKWSKISKYFISSCLLSCRSQDILSTDFIHT